MTLVGSALRSAMLDADLAIGALVSAQQVAWTSGAADLFRTALADADLRARRSRAASEAALHPVAVAEGLGGW